MSDEQKQEGLNESQVGLLAADAEEIKDEKTDLREKSLKSEGEEVEMKENPEQKTEEEEKKDEEKKDTDEKKEEPKTKQQLKAEEKAKKDAEKKAKDEEKKKKKEEEKQKKEEEKKRKEEEKKAKEEAKKVAKEAKLQKQEAAETQGAPEGELSGEGEQGVTKQPRKIERPSFFKVTREENRDEREVNNVVKVSNASSLRLRFNLSFHIQSY